MKGGEARVITTYKITKVIVDHVLSIKVMDNTTQEPMENSEKVIRVITEEGNEVEIILHSASAQALKFTDESDWVIPRVYKREEE
jgi:hypothetical protein